MGIRQGAGSNVLCVFSGCLPYALETIRNSSPISSLIRTYWMVSFGSIVDFKQKKDLIAFSFFSPVGHGTSARKPDRPVSPKASLICTKVSLKKKRLEQLTWSQHEALWYVIFSSYYQYTCLLYLLQLCSFLSHFYACQYVIYGCLRFFL